MSLQVTCVKLRTPVLQMEIVMKEREQHTHTHTHTHAQISYPNTFTGNGLRRPGQLVQLGKLNNEAFSAGMNKYFVEALKFVNKLF